jgi:hypothetical protein
MMREEGMALRALSDECPAVKQFKLCGGIKPITRATLLLNERSGDPDMNCDQMVMPSEFPESEFRLSLFDVYFTIVGKRLERPLEQIVENFETFLGEIADYANDDEKVVLLVRLLSQRCFDVPECIPIALRVCERLEILALDALEFRNLDVVREMAWFICCLSTIESFPLDREYAYMFDLMGTLIILEAKCERYDKDICIAAATAIHNVALVRDVTEIVSEEDMQYLVWAIMKTNSANPDLYLLEANSFVLFDFAAACPQILLTTELDETVGQMVGSSIDLLLYVRSELAQTLSICDRLMTDDSVCDTLDSLIELLAL